MRTPCLAAISIYNSIALVRDLRRNHAVRHKEDAAEQTSSQQQQEAQLSPRDRATRRVSLNRAKCRTNVRRIAFDKSCIRRMTFNVVQGHWKWHE